MKFTEQLIQFETENELSRGLGSLVNEEEGVYLPNFNSSPRNNKNMPDTEVLGIKIRLGNEPIVRNLKKVLEITGATLPPEVAVLFDTKDIYAIVHGIGAIRVEGNAKVDELQYYAEIIDAPGSQTIDMVPHTRYNEVFKLSANFSGTMAAGGNVSATIPAELSQALLPKYLTFGGDMQIQLSSDANFVGKFTYSLKFPIVQSLGIASNTCSWVLNPDENKTPLLGDQLLVQTVAVPKGTSKLTYSIHGVVKADKGLFFKQQKKETDKITVSVNLN